MAAVLAAESRCVINFIFSLNEKKISFHFFAVRRRCRLAIRLLLISKSIPISTTHFVILQIRQASGRFQIFTFNFSFFGHYHWQKITGVDSVGVVSSRQAIESSQTSNSQQAGRQTSALSASYIKRTYVWRLVSKYN